MRIPLWITLPLVALGCGDVGQGKEQTAGTMPRPEGWIDVGDGVLSPEGLFYCEAGRFFAAFPGMPRHEHKDLENDAGKIRMEMFGYEESSTRSFMVAYSDYPSAFVEKVGWSDLLSRAVAGASTALSIPSYDRQEDVVINGYHGIRWRGRNDKHLFVVAQMLLAGNRMYQITIVQDGAYPLDEVADQFLGKFHMVPPGQTAQQQDWWPQVMGGTAP